MAKKILQQGRAKPIQLSLLDSLRAAKPCVHDKCFTTTAYVPAGAVCFRCGKLLSQYLPQPPEVLGYVSADWAWHYLEGKAWTTQDPK